MRFNGDFLDHRLGSFWNPDRVLLFPLWLGYILTLNGLAEIVAGISLLNRMRWSFGWLFAISAPFWWFFEGMNEIVHNWHYQSPHPISPLQYFIQASIDFSTVVPATMSASFFILHIVTARPP